MKRIFSIATLILLPGLLAAQNKLTTAPYDAAYYRAIGQKGNQVKKLSESNTSLGYIPAPFSFHFNGKDQDASKLKSTGELPVRYDLREEGLVTPVKNQGSTGSCWTFATIGSIESRWLGLENISYDLSEQNLGMCHDFEWGINDGGNDMIAAAYLTRLDGPVSELDDPYQGLYQTSCATGLTPVAYSPEVNWLPARRDLLKEYLMKYGAIAVSMYTGGSQMSSYYNPSDYTFYYTGEAGIVNHAVLLVGWDDQKEVTGGSASQSSVGAWIVKNSWGTSWGEAGYFYVSYNDNAFLHTAAVYPVKEEVGANGNLIMHDHLGMVSAVGSQSEDLWGLMYIPVSTATLIRSIGTFVPAEASTVTISVYDEFDGDTLRSPALTSKTYETRFPGYYRFDLPLISNTDLWVSVRYHTPNYFYPLPAELTIPGYAYPEIEQSGTFWYSENGADWDPLGSGIPDSEFDLCIRAYTDYATVITPWFTADRTSVCTGTTVTFTDRSNSSAALITWAFGDGASPATATGPGPHSVTYSSTGPKSITQTVDDNGTPRTVTRTDYVDVVSALTVYTSATSVEVPDGDSLVIEAFGADSYEWSPAETLSSSSGKTVIAKPADDIVYTVTGTMGTCTGSATASLTIVYPPENDDICGAFTIEPGFSGTFTNVYATVERNEPAPHEGECDKPMEWCVEGGIQNSVWFTFIGPESGRATIITEGLDTQLAMYESEYCDSVSEDKMVAAFDDYFGEDKAYAAVLDYVEVIPGARYYVQCDGSAGGAEGTFFLSMTEFHVGTEDNTRILPEPDLKLYPNPAKEEFTVELGYESSTGYHISLTDITGRDMIPKLYIEGGPLLNKTLSTAQLSSGIYLVHVQFEQKSLVRRLIVQ